MNMVDFWGFFQKQIYSNGEYSVAVFMDAVTKNPFKVCGENVPKAKNIKYHFIGELQVYKKTGEQILKIVDYEIAELDSEKAFIEYLAMPPIRLGRAQGKKIYRLYGNMAVELLDNDPEVIYNAVFKNLMNGKKRYLHFIGEWKRQRKLLKITSFLVRYGVKRRDVVKLNDGVPLNKYDDLGEAVRDNPYFLMNVPGVYIDITICDEIAKKLHFPLNSPERIKAGVKYILRRAMQQGHMFMYSSGENGLVKEVSEFLHVQQNEVVSVLNSRPEELILEKDKEHGDYRIYLEYAHKWECGLAENIYRFLHRKTNDIISENEVQKFIETYQQENGIVLAERQKEAVYAIISNPITIITGGAGTGKTTSLKTILALLNTVGLKNNCLLASTGKASQRMCEATGYPASTIHSCIVCDDDSEGSGSYGSNIVCDALIIDEFSMTDCRVAHLLFSSIEDCERIIIVGDVEQLPSVGAGNVLRDMIQSGCIPVIALDVIQRQAKDSPIIGNAQKILHGQDNFVYNKNFQFIQVKNAAEASEYIIQRYISLVQERGMADVQILSPMKKNHCGTIQLNDCIQDKLFPTLKKERFRMGDKIMNTKNKHSLGISNGDIGYITKITEDGYTIAFDTGQTIDFSGTEMETLVLAYSITVHKSQGCEFPYVIMPILTEQSIMLYRNLLYTGITRAKETIELVGTKEMLKKAIETVRVVQRNTMLAKRLAYAEILYQKKIS